MARVTYVLNGRLPSLNGHVIQAVRVCEGLAAGGHDVRLLYSDRAQVNPELVGVDPAEFFGTVGDVCLQAVPYIDFNQFQDRVSSRLLRPFIVVSHLLFGLLALVAAKRTDADVYVTREWLVAYLLVKAGLPTVFEIHKTEGAAFSPRGRRAIASVATDPELRSVVTLTDETASGLAEVGIPREKILVEPDAVDPSAYESAPDQSEARTRVDADLRENVVGYTGSLHEGKGVYDLVSAVGDVEDTSLLLVGGTDREMADLRAYVAAEDVADVHLVGRVSPASIPTYQRAADVLVLPPVDRAFEEKHHAESTSPLKLFEYMAAARPIVATALPGITDVLTDERNALVVPPGEPSELRRSIERLLDDEQLASSLVRTAAEDVEQYTWASRGERVLSHAGVT